VNPDALERRVPSNIRTENLAAYIGRASHGQHGIVKGRMLYLSDYNQNTKNYRHEILLSGLNNMCRQAGFSVMSKGYEARANKLRVICRRGRIHKAKEGTHGSQMKKRQTPTNRPIKIDEKCKFSFDLFWDEGGASGISLSLGEAVWSTVDTHNSLPMKSRCR
jgi:hypothetical protein